MVTLERVACVVLALSGCTQQPPHAEVAPAPAPGARAGAALAARIVVAEKARRLELLLSRTGEASPEVEPVTPFRVVGMDNGRVPDFELVADGGEQYSSRALVGQQPFVTVFFATWCEYCSGQLTTLERALKQVGPMLVIPVSADGAETWGRVRGYLGSFGIQQPAVRAHDYPLFSASYDPFDTVPVLVVVGRDGQLVDYHVGYEPAHAERLVAALRFAKTIGPLARPQLVPPIRRE